MSFTLIFPCNLTVDEPAVGTVRPKFPCQSMLLFCKSLFITAKCQPVLSCCQLASIVAVDNGIDCFKTIGMLITEWVEANLSWPTVGVTSKKPLMFSAPGICFQG